MQQQQNRVNIPALLSLVAVTPVIFHGAAFTLYLIIASRAFGAPQAQMGYLVFAILAVLLCLAALALGVIGLLQREKPRMRWMAVASIAIAVTQLTAMILEALAGFVSTAFIWPL